jgi:hypothetical protein
MHKNGAFQLSESGKSRRSRFAGSRESGDAEESPKESDGLFGVLRTFGIPSEMAKRLKDNCPLAVLPFFRLAPLPFLFTISFLFTKVKIKIRQIFRGDGLLSPGQTTWKEG